MQKYWLQSASQPSSGLLFAGCPVSRPANCLWALKHLFQLALPSCPGILHLVGVIYILLLIKIHSGREGEEDGIKTTTENTRRNCGVTVHEKAHGHFMKWRCDKILTVCSFVCVWRVAHKIMQGLFDVLAAECLCLCYLFGAALCVDQQARETDCKLGSKCIL